MNKKENELAVISKNDSLILKEVLGRGLAEEIDFDQLDQAIENIGAHTEKLTDQERKDATVFINKFEKRVKNNIMERAHVLNRFAEDLYSSPSLSFNEVSNYVSRMEYPMAKLLTQKESLKEYQDGFELVLQAVKMAEEDIKNRPTEEILDESNMTAGDIKQAKLDYKVELAKYKADHYRLEFKARKAFYEFQTEIKKNKDFLEFVKQAKRQADAFMHASDIAEEKAMNAKMSLLVSDQSIREALRDFHEFAKALD